FIYYFFFFSSRRRHTRSKRDWSSDVCSSDLGAKLIKAGSDIIFEIHYNPNGKEVTDYSEFGLYFAKRAPSRRVLAIDTLRDLDRSEERRVGKECRSRWRS